MAQIIENVGAGEGNRTLVISLEGCCSTIELHPRKAFRRNRLPSPRAVWQTIGPRPNSEMFQVKSVGRSRNTICVPGLTANTRQIVGYFWVLPRVAAGGGFGPPAM